MDRDVQEDMQFLGFLGIIKESIKIIFTWRKIFSQIALALILPLSSIVLVQIQVINYIIMKIYHRELSDLVKTDTINHWLFGAVCSIASLIFHLLSTAAVTYTVACIYTAKSITSNKVRSVVPKVWKRLIITFQWSTFTILAYVLVFEAICFLVVITIKSKAISVILLSILLVLYLAGVEYITAIWSLASVVSVLEESHGFQAMIKSKNLIKGKTGVSVAIFTVITLVCMVAQVVLYIFVADGWGLGCFTKLGIGFLCFLVLFKLILFDLVVQTVIYFVCKSYHHENIDKLVLEDDLEVLNLLPGKVDV